MKKLFLLDGMALIYRAHFALSKTPRFTSGGLNTSAVLVFTNTLLDVLKKEKPTHILVLNQPLMYICLCYCVQNPYIYIHIEDSTYLPSVPIYKKSNKKV